MPPEVESDHMHHAIDHALEHPVYYAVPHFSNYMLWLMFSAADYLGGR